MQEKLNNLESEFQKDIINASAPEAIDNLRIKYLGRKSELTQLFNEIPRLEPSQRGAFGKALNNLKQKISSIIDEKAKQLISGEAHIDLTYPAASKVSGSVHVLSDLNRRICDVFEKLGFAIVEGNEIEDEWHNFQALNIPLEHPSRDAFDTFYLNLPASSGGEHLLRSHTSPSQARIMQNSKPPLAVISPGRVYRPDEVDATHSFMFHQIEGFAVNTDITFAHLKGVLSEFAQAFFSEKAKLRFRPHFFPFTEPSAEVDVTCIICSGKPNPDKKCSVCKDKGWLEILGCGMIHPNVLKACGINPKKYKGFAFGMGVERIAMLKYGIDDIRLFYENDIRFLKQF
jgi:phenylalanyl-tRNA synthetase alpha chain